MKAYSLKKVKEIVRAYNAQHDVRAAAEQVKLPLAEVRAILVWLENNDPLNSKPDAQTGVHYQLALPTAKVWCKWLYEHGISPRTAAACVNWPYERLLQSCGGKMQWLLCGAERKRYLRKPELLDRQPGDPTPEEILERAAELRRDVADKPERVEIREFFYDRRTMSFEVPS